MSSAHDLEEKRKKIEDEILPARRPHCLYRTGPTCVGTVAMCMWSCLNMKLHNCVEETGTLHVGK